MIVTITELRRHFGRYLQLVMEGKTLIVTKYGEILLEIQPIKEPVHRNTKDVYLNKKGIRK